MKTQRERRLEDVLNCRVGDVDSTYERLLDVFADEMGVGTAMFFRAVDIDGEPHYDGVRYRGASTSFRQTADSLEGRPVLAGPSLDIFCPEPDEINQFKSVEVTQNFTGTNVSEDFLTPHDIHSSARIMVYRGGRFAGWLGCFRGGNQPRCDHELRRRLGEMSDPIRAALSAVEQIKRDRWIDGEGFAVFDPEGRLDYASADVVEFLDESRRRRIAEIVTRVDAGELEQCVRYVDGAELRVTRLKGEGVLRYLAQISPPTIAYLDPLAWLTPAQREVAGIAATGATNAEIARQTDRSTQTVKVHMRNIYDRLDIGSRVELVRMVCRTEGE